MRRPQPRPTERRATLLLALMSVSLSLLLPLPVLAKPGARVPAPGRAAAGAPAASVAAAAAADAVALRLSPQLQLRAAAGPDPAVAPWTWPQVLEWAATHASAVRAARAQAEAQEGVAAQARAAARMPRLDLNAAVQQEHLRTQLATTRTPGSSVGVQASLPVWRGADRATEAAQAALEQRTRWQARSTRMALAREISRTYLLAVEAAAQLDLLEEQRALLTAQLHVNEQRLKGGVGTSLDRLETVTRLDQLRADVHERRVRFETQRLALGRLLGREVPAVARLAPWALQADDAGPVVVPPVDEALAGVAERSPAVQDAQAQVQAAQADIEARRAETWQPTLDAVASVNRARQVTKSALGNDVLNYTESSVGLQLAMPLFTGGRQGGRNRESAALLARAEAERDGALAGARADLLDAYQTLEQSRRQVAALRDAERTAQSTLDALQRAFAAGYRSNLDLLNAQQLLIAARSQSVTARINALLAQADILGLTEQLEPAAVAPLASLLGMPGAPTESPR